MQNLGGRKYVRFWSKKQTTKGGGRLHNMFSCCIKSSFSLVFFGWLVGFVCGMVLCGVGIYLFLIRMFCFLPVMTVKCLI